jgi:ribosomal protein S18 acetylase RimI-like enzyme
MEINIKIATDADLERIATCYLSAFPQSISSKLGTKYIKHNLGWFLNDTNRFLFFCEVDSNCVGFCGGYVWMKNGDGSTSSMLNYSKGIRNEILIRKPWVLFDQSSINKVIKFIKIKFNLFLKSKKIIENTFTRNQPSTGLVVIGVDPLYKGKNIASSLIEYFEQISINRGINNLHLSVRKENTRAIEFYKKHHWLIQFNADKENETFSMCKVLNDIS